MKRIAALYMRGGAAKGVFFQESDLPADPAARCVRAARDRQPGSLPSAFERHGRC